MSTPIVVSVTDELVAELERECREAADIHGGAGSDYDSRLFDRLGDALKAMLAERAELKRDSERYRWICQYADVGCRGHAPDGDYASLDERIDAAIQSEAKP